MNRGAIPFGKAFGITLRLHWSWFFIFALITWSLTAYYYPTIYPDWSLAAKISAGLITSFLFFGSVLLHELMHSVVAIHEGIQIQAITLFFLGGVSEMTGEPKTAADEFRMAGAGPGSSLVLGGILIGIFFAVGGKLSGIGVSGIEVDINATAGQGLLAQYVGAIASYLGYINILLGIFNLIPGFPLDGGRVLRSFLWWRSGNLQSATRVASAIGRGVGFLFIGGGIFLVFTPYLVNGILLALVGWFLESAATGSYRQILLQDMLKGHVAGEIMSSDCTIVPPDMTVDRLVNENMLAGKGRCFPVAVNNTLQGLATLDSVKRVPRDRWSTTRVTEAMVTLDKMKAVAPSDDLFKVLQLMSDSNVNQVPVVSDHTIVGMIGRDRLIDFINTQSALRSSRN